jgi:hypothetical protein
MTSLGEAYGGAGTDRRRLYLGVGLFLVGSVALVAAIVATSTDLVTGAGYSVGEVREFGGIVGGIGVPLALLGVFTVMPAARRTRAAAVVGASVSMLGVALFSHAYPCRWVNATCGPAAADLTLPTVGIYFLGAMTTLWCLLVGVANLKTRNDPGGTATVDVVRKNETRVVEVDDPSPGFGGIGLFGADPDGEVATQTASDGGADDDPVVRSPGGSGAGTPARSAATGSSQTGAGTGVGNTGTATQDAPGSSTAVGGQTQTQTQTQTRTRTRTRSGSATGTASSTNGTGRDAGDRARTTGDAGAGVAASGGRKTRSTADATGGGGTGTGSTGAEGSRPAGDAYCGSCRHFEYVRTDEGMQPYCGHHEELMEDMDACDAWEARGDGRLLVD